MIKKIFCLTLFVVLGAALLVGCRGYNRLEYISDTLGVDVSHGTVLDSQDSHGGFHGDGLLAVTISLTQEQAQPLLSQFERLSAWHPFPLPENLTTALYGKTTTGYSQAALIREESTDTLLVPEISNGWYYFYDRHSQAEDPLDDSPLFSRASYNCTIAIFDADTLTLYFFEIDT